MTRFVRWVFLALLTLMVLPVAQEFFIELAREGGLYESPTETMGGFLGYVQMIADIPGFYYMLAGVAGATFGVWLDAILRRIDSKKPTKKQKIMLLGQNCNNIARNAKTIAHNAFLYGRDYPDLLNAYRLIAMDLRDWGIEAPPPDRQDIEANADMIYKFLAAVGSLLAHNRFAEAKETARALREHLSQG